MRQTRPPIPTSLRDFPLTLSFSRHVYLVLLTSERAWAQAMSFKASHTADQKGIVGRARSHIISRLHKAAISADQLAEALSESDVSGASTTDILEAKAYASMIHGAELFEKQNWEPCLQNYATCRIIYTALSTAAKSDIFRDLLSETIDPSIRYAAYRLKTPRTIPIPIIARKAFPQSDSALAGEISKIDPNVLKQGDKDSAKETTEEVPNTLTWRNREVKIEDAQIAQAWGAVDAAREGLTQKLATLDESHLFEVAAAYDEILASSQDAVDATKQAIDELRAEGVGQGDARMQSLQITRTAVNYEMLSWRIGRNRVLTGAQDGAIEEYSSPRRHKRNKAAQEAEKKAEKELPTSKKIAKLREKVALYDGNLQNLQSIKELPGVAADQELAAKLDASVKYFQALLYVSPMHDPTYLSVPPLTFLQKLVHRSFARHRRQRHQRPRPHRPLAIPQRRSRITTPQHRRQAQRTPPRRHQPGQHSVHHEPSHRRAPAPQGHRAHRQPPQAGQGGRPSRREGTPHRAAPRLSRRWRGSGQHCRVPAQAVPHPRQTHLPRRRLELHRLPRKGTAGRGRACEGCRVGQGA